MINNFHLLIGGSYRGASGSPLIDKNSDSVFALLSSHHIVHNADGEAKDSRTKINFVEGVSKQKPETVVFESLDVIDKHATKENIN